MSNYLLCITRRRVIQTRTISEVKHTASHLTEDSSHVHIFLVSAMLGFPEASGKQFNRK